MSQCKLFQSGRTGENCQRPQDWRSPRRKQKTEGRGAARGLLAGVPKSQGQRAEGRRSSRGSCLLTLCWRAEAKDQRGLKVGEQQRTLSAGISRAGELDKRNCGRARRSEGCSLKRMLTAESLGEFLLGRAGLHSSWKG